MVGKVTILLIDDELPLQRAIAKGLRMLGYQVFEACNGMEALQLWQDYHNKIDVLFTDMELHEGTTGLDLAEQMKKEKPTLKIMLSSGYEHHASLQHHPIINGYLPKPYAMDQLSNAIRECCA